MIDLWEHWDLVEHINNIYHNKSKKDETEEICDEDEEMDSDR